MPQAFEQFAFTATGGAVGRTDPDRWADWHNVKEYGAIGNGVADDTAAIQAAVDWVVNVTGSRGTVYFPRGTYKITQPVTLPIGNGNATFCLCGDGDASLLTGNVSGFILDRFDAAYNFFTQIVVIEKLKVANQNTSSNTGGIRLGATQFTAVRDCTISGFFGLVYNMNDLGVACTAFPNCSSFPFQIMNCRIVPISGSITAGSCGVASGNNSAMVNCYIRGYDKGIACVGVANDVVGGHIEGCNYGIFAGGDQLGHSYGTSMFVRSAALVNNNVAGFYLNSGIVTLSGLSVRGNGGQYGIYCGGGGAAQQSSFLGCVVSGSYSVAGIIVDDGPPGSGGSGDQYNTFIGCNASNSGAGVAWQMPVNSPSARFLGCNNPAPLVTFLTLPLTTGGFYHPVVGDDYMISDSPTVTAGNFAAVIAAGGGANNARVRWNGSNWILM